MPMRCSWTCRGRRSDVKMCCSKGETRMRISRPLLTCAALILWSFASLAYAVEDARDAIPIGTKITMRNWQQYRQFMPDGMSALFEGKYFWKMPADVEMDIGPTRAFAPPPGYVTATEKYGGQTEAVVL